MGSFLDKPIEKHETHGPDEGNGQTAAMACMQGWRVDMEDAHTVEVSVPRKTDYSFYAVFDGHGGSYIAKVAAETLLDRIMDQPAFERADESPEFLKTAMIEGFKVLDYEMRQSPPIANNEDHSGSTAITCMVTPTHIVFANCGDSRAILVTLDGGCAFGTKDHKPDDREETARIVEAGGTVTMKRVNGDLAVSRALGDYVYKNRRGGGQEGGGPSDLADPDRQQVSCIPDVTIIPRTEDHAFIVLCCDGIWDVMSNEQVAKLAVEWTAEGHKPLGLAGKLINKGLADGSKDNMSAIFVALPGAPKPPANAVVPPIIDTTPTSPL